ncbi:hypothetical protein MKEN_01029900 [Mycena kentingensis (nom. inval.)]|nr:hypothetical protein MKEN_01029900 [Mycena kentingensis (nom. inval.)]
MYTVQPSSHSGVQSLHGEAAIPLALAQDLGPDESSSPTPPLMSSEPLPSALARLRTTAFIFFRDALLDESATRKRHAKLSSKHIHARTQTGAAARGWKRLAEADKEPFLKQARERLAGHHYASI